MLIDGDLAVELGTDKTLSPGHTISVNAFPSSSGCDANGYIEQGTLPYMSRRILDAWLFEEAYVHTPKDDLESYVWVHLLTALRKPSSPSWEQETLSLLEGHDVRASLAAKNGFRTNAGRRPRSREDPVYGLVHKWLRILDEDDTTSAPGPLFTGAFIPLYKDVLKAGFDWLQEHDTVMRLPWAEHPSPFV